MLITKRNKQITYLKEYLLTKWIILHIPAKKLHSCSCFYSIGNFQFINLQYIYIYIFVFSEANKLKLHCLMHISHHPCDRKYLKFEHVRFFFLNFNLV